MISSIEAWIRRNLGNLLKYYYLLPVWMQNLVVSARGLILTRVRYQPSAWTLLEELGKHDRFSRDELDEYQIKSLNELLASVRKNNPYWREIIEGKSLLPEKIKSMSDFSSSDFFLTREMVRDNCESMISSRLSKRNMLVFHTSGTTGSGLKVVTDKYSNMAFWIHQQRQYNWAGADIRDWRISLFGAKIVPLSYSGKKLWRTNYFEHQHLLSIFHINSDNMKYYMDFFKKHKGFILEGFPSSLNILADLINGSGETFKMKFIVTTGEPIADNVRNKIERAFSCKLFDSYGMTEEAGLILECEYGRMHQLSDFGVLEIVDGDGKSVPPGIEGDFLWTGFYQRAMPFIRYKIGDRGMWAEEQDCPCGRKYPVVKPTITRDSDYMQTREGDLITARMLSPLIKEKTAFKMCQFIQESLDTICIRYVPGKGEHEVQAESLKISLIQLLGNDIDIFIVKADSPIVRGSGKIPLILSNVRNQ